MVVESLLAHTARWAQCWIIVFGNEVVEVQEWREEKREGRG